MTHRSVGEGGAGRPGTLRLGQWVEGLSAWNAHGAKRNEVSSRVAVHQNP